MKKIIVLIAFVFSAAICSNLYAQVAPPGSSDKDLHDTNIKDRSNELERIDREAHKTNNVKSGNAPANQPTAPIIAKFPEIKEDFEQIQTLQTSIVEGYSTGDKIDYAKIGKSAADMNKSAIRLNGNLFSVEKTVEKPDDKKEKKEKKETAKEKSVRDLIVELDNAVGSFSTSKMFQNLMVVDTPVWEKAQVDLENIIKLSAALKQQTEKMK